MAVTISSAANPVVARLRRLAERRHRERERAVVVHGTQVVRQGVEAGAVLDTLVVRAGAPLDASTAEFVARAGEGGARIVHLAAELLGRLSGRDGPSTLSAVFALPQAAGLAVPPPPAAVTVVALDRIANPGNLGTVVRSANAAGATGVAVLGPTADPFDPAALRASMGAVFRTPVVRFDDLGAFLGWAGGVGVTVVATSGRAPQELWRTTLPARVAFLLGQEGPGLAEADVARCAAAVAIPMRGTAESLNLAAAATVLLYEHYRQRAADR